MKHFAIAAVVLGAVGTLVLFVLWAGNALPYQDPTPELLMSQNRRGTLYVAGMLLSVLLTVLGCAALWRARRRPQPS